MTQPKDLEAAIAATRFGLGARPGELARIAPDPRGWLLRQVAGAGAEQPQGDLKSTAELLGAFDGYRIMRQRAKAKGEVDATETKAARRRLIADLNEVGMIEDVRARSVLAARTDESFRERWTLFWCNHFTVSGQKRATGMLVGPFEREVIRPHVFGRFEDMLVASTRHPAMLNYLNQVVSVGPNSPAGARNRRGLNENLAREVLELHTVGSAAGYTQEDVTEFARALTGWSAPRRTEELSAAGFLYRAQAHEPGARKVLGRVYPDKGEGQARAILKDLAAHPATARHVSRKLAAHFVSDDPPGSLVDRLAGAFVESGGRLDVLARSLIEAPECWRAEQQKFKSPYDFVVSSWRALGTAPDTGHQALAPLKALGQRTYIAPSPKGWPDDAGAWAGPAELLKRIDFAEAAAPAFRQDDPRVWALSVLGPLARPKTLKAMARAQNQAQAVAILLMSPEFQRR